MRALHRRCKPPARLAVSYRPGLLLRLAGRGRGSIENAARDRTENLREFLSPTVRPLLAPLQET